MSRDAKFEARTAMRTTLDSDAEESDGVRPRYRDAVCRDLIALAALSPAPRLETSNALRTDPSPNHDGGPWICPPVFLRNAFRGAAGRVASNHAVTMFVGA